jgi:hypothetical protein
MRAVPVDVDPLPKTLVNGCTGKVKIPSRKAARTKVKRLNAEKARGSDRWAAYKCKHCTNWHVTGHDKGYRT